MSQPTYHNGVGPPSDAVFLIPFQTILTSSYTNSDYLPLGHPFYLSSPLARTDYLNPLKILPKLHICVILIQIRQIVSFPRFFVQTMPNHYTCLIITQLANPPKLLICFGMLFVYFLHVDNQQSFNP